MPVINYEIKLNDEGRPCIELPIDYEQNSEDKFFVLEMTRYFLESTYSRMSIPPFDQHTIETMNNSALLLGEIGDEMARIVWHNMKIAGDAQILIGAKYHVQCESIEERNNIDNRGIIFQNKLYIRQEGLKVRTMDNDGIWKTFELKGGISNDNWVEI